MKNYFYIIAPKIKIIYKMETNDRLKIYFDNVDNLLRELYGNKVKIQTVLKELDVSKSLSFIKIQEINEKDVLKCFSGFIKQKMPYKINGNIKNTFSEIKNYYRRLVKQINETDNKLSYKILIELIGNMSFRKEGINFPVNKHAETNKEIIECYLIDKVKFFIQNKLIDNNKKIFEFIKYNHLLFCTDDNLQKILLQFFFVINVFLFRKYDKFSNYEDFIMNFYYLYYKYNKPENLDILKNEVLSKINEIDFTNFSLDKEFINENLISSLIQELENLEKNKAIFKLAIDERLLNNSTLLKLFHSKEIDKEKIKSFFKFSTIQDNYFKFLKNKEKNFDLAIDDLEYNEKKLHVFNIYYIISCGLIDKIDKDSLQIFNEDNNIISLIKKNGNILIENINKVIDACKNKKDIPQTDENFGFGKIFKSFHVLYSNFNNVRYREEKLKLDLFDNLIVKNVEDRPIHKININTDNSDKLSNFTKLSQDSNIEKNDEEKYCEKLNSESLEEGCKKYIISKIEDAIDENLNTIKINELFKILFGLNYFIPFIDKNNSLGFYPIAKQLNYSKNDNNKEYGYQEYDYLFQVSGNNDIIMNSNEQEKFPFIKSIQIKFDCTDTMHPRIKLEKNNKFVIKKNSFVIIENKTKFPKIKTIFNNYIGVMIRKLNFALKLKKNSLKNLENIEEIQLLLIYDDIVFNSDVIEKMIDIDDLKKIVIDVSFSENVKFNIEIVYISQIVHYYNSFNDFKERRKLKGQIEDLQNKNKEIVNKNKVMENEINALKSIIENMENKIKQLQNQGH